MFQPTKFFQTSEHVFKIDFTKKKNIFSGDVERCRRRPSSPIYSKKLNPLPLLREGESIGSPSDAQIFSLDNSFFTSYVQAGCQPMRMLPSLSPSCPTTGNREAIRPSKGPNVCVCLGGWKVESEGHVGVNKSLRLCVYENDELSSLLFAHQCCRSGSALIIVGWFRIRGDKNDVINRKKWGNCIFWGLKASPVA